MKLFDVLFISSCLLHIWLWIGPAFAAPFAISDAVDNVATHCGIYMDGNPKVVIPVTAVGPGKICKYDVGHVDVGGHVITMTAIAQDPVWGDVESPQSVPFTFVRPGGVTQPSIVGLEP